MSSINPKAQDQQLCNCRVSFNMRARHQRKPKDFVFTVVVCVFLVLDQPCEVFASAKTSESKSSVSTTYQNQHNPWWNLTGTEGNPDGDSTDSDFMYDVSDFDGERDITSKVLTQIEEQRKKKDENEKETSHRNLTSDIPTDAIEPVIESSAFLEDDGLNSKMQDKEFTKSWPRLNSIDLNMLGKDSNYQVDLSTRMQNDSTTGTFNLTFDETSLIGNTDKHDLGKKQSWIEKEQEISESDGDSTPMTSQPLQTLERLQQMLEETDYKTSTNRQRRKGLDDHHAFSPETSTTIERSNHASDENSRFSSGSRVSHLTKPSYGKSDSNSIIDSLQRSQPQALWTSKNRSKYRRQQQKLRLEQQLRSGQNTDRTVKPPRILRAPTRAALDQSKREMELPQSQQSFHRSAFTKDSKFTIPSLPQFSHLQTSHPNDFAPQEDGEEIDDGLGYVLPNLPVYYSDAEDDDSDLELEPISSPDSLSRKQETRQTFQLLQQPLLQHSSKQMPQQEALESDKKDSIRRKEETREDRNPLQRPETTSNSAPSDYSSSVPKHHGSTVAGSNNRESNKSFHATSTDGFPDSLPPHFFYPYAISPYHKDQQIPSEGYKRDEEYLSAPPASSQQFKPYPPRPSYFPPYNYGASPYAVYHQKRDLDTEHRKNDGQVAEQDQLPNSYSQPWQTFGFPRVPLSNSSLPRHGSANDFTDRYYHREMYHPDETMMMYPYPNFMPYPYHDPYLIARQQAYAQMHRDWLISTGREPQLQFGRHESLLHPSVDSRKAHSSPENDRADDQNRERILSFDAPQTRASSKLGMKSPENQKNLLRQHLMLHSVPSEAEFSLAVAQSLSTSLNEFKIPPQELVISNSETLIEANSKISFDSLQKITLILATAALICYASVSPRTLPLTEYNLRFYENIRTVLLATIAPAIEMVSVFDARFNDINEVINIFFVSFTAGYMLVFLVELLATTLIRLLVFRWLEPDVFALTPAIPAVILPWVLRENNYRPKRITLFAADFITTCILSPIIEEYAKLLILRSTTRLERNFKWISKTTSKRRKKRLIAEPVVRKGKKEITNGNQYVTSMLAASLGIKLCDAGRRILLYTKPYHSNQSFYSLCRGCFPIQELCGTMTAIALAKRDLLGLPMPLWKLSAPAVLVHSMANLRGMKPIFKWNSATPWSEMQLSPLNVADDSTLPQLLKKGYAKLMWAIVLSRVFGFCVKNYYMVNRQAMKRTTTYAGKPAAFSAEIATAEMLRSQRI